MSLSIVTNPEEISNYHKEFGKIMRQNSTGKPRKLFFTTRGGSENVMAYHDKENNLWWSNDEFDDDNKFHNLIGVNPDFGGVNHILIQINYQRQFETFREAAFWGKDNRGRVFLLHNGKMGGGVKGFTYENIDYLYSGARSNVASGETEFESYTVCELYSPNAYEQVITFIEEIIEIKNKLKNETIDSSSRTKSSYEMKDYSPEFWGKRKSYLRTGKIISKSNHGFIVNSLKRELEDNYLPECKFVKNKLVDLGVVKKRNPFAIFEIKTSTNLYPIYTAVGQLTLHAHNINTKAQRFIVLPDDMENEIVEDLEALGINTIFYKLDRNKIQFTNLKKFFA